MGHLLWKTLNTYVDTETGEVLPKEIATDKKQYKIIKRIKTISHGKIGYCGTVHYTVECRKLKYTQQRIVFT